MSRGKWTLNGAPPKSDKAQSWATADEMKYLNHIGQHGVVYLGAADMLRGYLRGIEGRRDWRGLDRDAIRTHATRLLLDALDRA